MHLAAGRYDLPDPVEYLRAETLGLHHAFKKTAELFATLTGDSAGFDAVCLRIGTIWGRLGLPDSPFFALLMLAERLNHGTYNVSTGRLVRNSEVVAAINAAVPGAIPAGPRTTTSTPPGCGRTPVSGWSTTSSAPYPTTSAGSPAIPDRRRNARP